MADAGRTLTEALQQLGVESVSLQPGVWRSALRDRLAAQPTEASLLVTALDAGVASRLIAGTGPGDVDAMTAQLARAYGLSPDSAAWAVQTWAQALDVPRSPGVPRAGRFREDATVLRAPGTVTAPAPPKKAGHSRRLLGLVVVVVLAAIIACVVVFVLRDSDDGSGSPGYVAISPVLAHRGDHEGYPQETLPAFLQAAHRGFTIETDVRWTKDNVAIINHDPRTGRGMVCRGGPYEVAATTWAVLHSRCRTPASLSKTHRSYGIPTFATTVQQLSRIRGATLFAEIKIAQTSAQNKKYLSILRRNGMLTRTVATSYSSAYLEDFGREVKREDVHIRTLRFAGVNAPTTLAELRHSGVWGAVFEQGWDRTPARLASARKAGLHVGVITLARDEGPTQWSAARKLGAQFVLTDRPSAYQGWLDEH